MCVYMFGIMHFNVCKRGLVCVCVWKFIAGVLAEGLGMNSRFQRERVRDSAVVADRYRSDVVLWSLPDRKQTE